MLEEEVRFYEEHRPEWASEYPGKFVMVKGSSLVGVFGALEEALAEGARRFGLDNFLVRSTDAPPRPVSIPAIPLGVLHANPPSPVRRG